MTSSTWLIRPPAEQKKDENVGALRIRSQINPANNSSFAALMADQKESLSRQSSANSRPQTSQPLQQAIQPLRMKSNFILAGRTPSELMRVQAFDKAQTDLRQAQAISGLMQSVSASASTLDLARSMGAARHLRSLSGSVDPQMSTLGLGDVVHACPTQKPRQRQPAKKTALPESDGLGMLSARFESGGDGIAAIGYDRNGGTSYGKYQIASRVGSMKAFLNFLDGTAPDIAERLRKSGPANTGSRRGAMPDTWRKIAREQPERFESLQEAFIRESHYKPAVDSIVKRTGLEEDKLSPAMREVIWSTAVQHGPAGAARIFDRADDMSGKATAPGYERKLISNVYKIRAGQFGSSSSQVRAAVQNRFKEERTLALNMLNADDNSSLA